MMRNYEIMYIVRPNIEEDAKKSLIERFRRNSYFKRSGNHRIKGLG